MQSRACIQALFPFPTTRLNSRRCSFSCALPMILGWLANRNLRGNGTLSTHWRMGSWAHGAITSSTRKAALSAIRRAPQLGQKPLRLQLKATRCSAWLSHCTRRKPGSKANAFKNNPIAHSPTTCVCVLPLPVPSNRCQTTRRPAVPVPQKECQK